MLQALCRSPNKLVHNLYKVHTKNYSRNTSQEEPNYRIERVTKKKDYDCILDLLHNAFYPEEPLSMSLAFKPTEQFDEATKKELDEGLSLILRCKCTDDILGASVNRSSNIWDADMMDRLACQVDDDDSRHMLHFLAHLQRAPKLWKKCGAQKIFEIHQVAVRRDQRKKGLALKLMEASRTLAADAGYHLVRCDATSAYTAILCEKMRMKMANFIPYCSYVGEDKEPIFRPPEPHLGVKTYVDDDPQSNCQRVPWKLRKLDPDSYPKF